MLPKFWRSIPQGELLLFRSHSRASMGSAAYFCQATSAQPVEGSTTRDADQAPNSPTPAKYVTGQHAERQLRILISQRRILICQRRILI